MKSIFYLLISLCFFTSCSQTNCDKNKSAYEEGFWGGKTCSTTGVSGSCSQYLKSMQDGGQYGNYATCSDCEDCYCEGWNDGYKGNKNRYPEEDKEEETK